MRDNSTRLRIAYFISDVLDVADEERDDDLSDRLHYVLAFMTLSDVQSDIISEIEHFEYVMMSDDEADRRSKVYIYYQALFDEVILFYVLYQDLVDYYSIRLLHDELIDEEYANSNKSYELLERQSQKEREQLLKRTGILDHKYTDKMKEIRTLRNNLVHEPNARISPDTVEGLIGNIDVAGDVLEVLHTRVEDVPYWPEPVESILDGSIFD